MATFVTPFPFRAFMLNAHVSVSNYLGGFEMAKQLEYDPSADGGTASQMVYGTPNDA